MRRTLIALAAASAVLVAACSDGGGGPTAMRVEFTDSKFLPETIVLPAGTKALLQITNSGSVEHDITAEALNLRIALPTAKRQQVEVGPFVAGTYDVHCSVAGHRELGMVAKIVVK